jgi:DNA-directed RNA polymerase specialized sigma subunit
VHDLTQREIGVQIGYSQMHVSRVLRRALEALGTDAVAA